jgi:hypothetical protein
MWLGAVVAMAAALTLGGCTHSGSSGPGAVTGFAPVCYGPGQNMNLRPMTIVRATPKSGGPITSIRVVTNDKQHTYRLSLAPGAYAIGIDGGQTVAVMVKSGKMLTGVDLPGPACL